MSDQPTGIVGRTSIRQRLVLAWVRGRALDHVSLLIVAAWGSLTWAHALPVFLTEVPIESRRVIFQTLAAVSGTMAGLTLTSVSIMVNLVRTPLSTLDKLLDPTDKRRVGSVFLAALPHLLLCFVFAIVTIAVEPTVGTHGVTAIGSWWSEGLTLWFALAAISGLARIVWVLRRLLLLS